MAGKKGVVTRPKGTPKTGGRVAGTPNNYAEDLRNEARRCALQRLPDFFRRLDSIEDDAVFCRVFGTFYARIVPNQSEIQIDTNAEEVNNIIHNMFNND